MLLLRHTRGGQEPVVTDFDEYSRMKSQHLNTGYSPTRNSDGMIGSNPAYLETAVKAELSTGQNEGKYWRGVVC